MSSARDVILEIVCPLMGCILSNVMFAAPIRAVKEAIDRGYLGDLNPTPWAFMLGNCTGWVAYSFLINNLFVFFANAPGLMLSVWLNMCAAKLQYKGNQAKSLQDSLSTLLQETDWEDEEEEDEMNDGNDAALSTKRKKEKFSQLVMNFTKQDGSTAPPLSSRQELLVLIMVLGWLTILAVLIFARLPSSTSELVVGIAVNVNLLSYYGAPLSTIFVVIKTRNSASIHLGTMLTNTANSAFWTAYGLAVLDPFILVPSVIGVGLGLAQFVLRVLFPVRTTTDTTPDNPPQLNNNNKEREDAITEDGREAKDAKRPTPNDGSSPV